jgi:hypothetical protein
MSNIRMSGSPVVPVCRGGYVSEDNPLPVSVIGGGVELPTESSGVLSCNLNSVSAGLSVPVEVSNTPNVNVTNSVLNVLDSGGYTLANQNATFISGSGYNKGWNTASPGWNSLFTATNQRVRLLGVASEANQIFAFQKPEVFTIYFPCNVVIDLIGLQNGSFNGSATEGFCSVVNSSSVGILLMYWVYS